MHCLDFNLICCHEWYGGNSKYAYCHSTLGHNSFVDHILLSKSLNSFVVSCEVVDSGTNLSDHIPRVLCLMS